MSDPGGRRKEESNAKAGHSRVRCASALRQRAWYLEERRKGQSEQKQSEQLWTRLWCKKREKVEKRDGVVVCGKWKSELKSR